ncbi:AAA family ATPase [Berryella wangjianweii]|uniref:AAA family ATPase n=1 Tax=Berryella wangjianweii TaxID=2734634 RepID=A0A6M8J0S9_9ACTN|nr:AAA family ATPase [Berryella wangjianweii]QKF07580.1 AAA family ATPase [Berryella wangjianweii]
MRHALRYVRLDAFGSFHGRTVGPFRPGLNVVVGPNEAGKSTVWSLVVGVLFGWPRPKAGSSGYAPASGSRAGSLVFAQVDESVAREGGSGPASANGRGGEGACEAPLGREGAGVRASMRAGEERADATVVSRVKATGDPACEGPATLDGLLGGVDRMLYESVFALNALSLQSLDGADNLMARFLTAGSSTAVSPAEALAVLDERIKASFSLAQTAPDSLAHLREAERRTRADVAAAAARAEELRADHRRLADARQRQRQLVAQLAEWASRRDRLVRAAASLNVLEDQFPQLESECVAASSEVAAARAALDRVQASAAHTPLSRERLASLRFQLEEAAVELRHAAQVLADARGLAAVASAEGASASGGALRDALLLRGAPKGAGRAKLLGGFACLMAALLGSAALAAASLFSSGADSATWGVFVLVVASLIGLGVAGARVLAAALGLRREGGSTSAETTPSEANGSGPGARTAAPSSALASARVHEAIRAAEHERARDAAGELLRAAGLSVADGSPTYALQLIDADLARFDAIAQAQDQLDRALAREAAAVSARARSAAARRRVIDSLDADGQSDAACARAQAAHLDQRIAEAEAEGRALSSLIGSLEERLGAALDDRLADRAKVAHEQAVTGVAEAEARLVRMLAARSLLREAIDRWSVTSQPLLYREASRLIALMTNGAWTRVVAQPDGSLALESDALVRRPATQLSLGTSQQLYLALRIALLRCADDVGPSLPVLADDILVHFDRARRHGAARALAELARTRQVVVFTCHEEVADALLKADPGAHRLCL